jgi:serine/threonine protein phosphatase PrpC
VARDVVERRMLDLLEPDWNLNGEAAAEDLQRSVRRALEERLAELKAPVSRLRSKLLRALPTTMAVIALQRTARGGSTWSGHVFWAGDSRAYVVTADGVAQLSTDDLRDPGDALANLRRDSVVSNAMSADTDFHVSYRRVSLEAPFLLIGATDGCFGYVPTPMHFEHLLLRALAGARSAQAWSSALQAAISEVTGDDAAMAVMGVGTDFRGFQALLAPRLAELERTVIGPLDGLRSAVADAERALQQARQRHEAETAGLWRQYQVGYERYLRAVPDDLDDEAEPLPDDESPDGGAEPADHSVDDEPADLAEPEVESEAEPQPESERRAEVPS